MPQKIQGAQRDFSFGEIDVALKRSDDHPARKAGLRQMSNMRILNSRALQNRPGRRALFPITGNCSRIEKFTISSGNNFKIAFGPNLIQILNEAGAVVASFANKGSGGSLPWVTVADINSIVHAIFGLSIYITYGHSMRPQVITWDGVATWSISDYIESTGGRKRTTFYRISPQGVRITPSAQSGNITIAASSPIFSAAQVGTRIRFINRQILITGFTDSQHVSGTVEETLPGSQVIGFASSPLAVISTGDEVIGSVSGSKGIVTGTTGTSITVQLLHTSSTSYTSISGQLNVVSFVGTDIIVGPGGSIAANAANSITAPSGCTAWDDEVMNDFRGYPASVFVDQFRLGFCDFPSVPGGICWSAINSPTDIYANETSSPENAIFEIAPAKTRVFYVVPGPESSEFVFCEHRIYYIKIDASNPLRPGSVGFQTLSGDGAARVQPRVSEDCIFYVNAGGNSVMAVIAPGAYYRPFNTKGLCDFHGHLFTNIVALAAPNADGTFNERYLYALNADGSMACGKYNAKDGQIAEDIGWGPWSGGGIVEWISAWNADVNFTTTYYGVGICEVLDDTQYLDCAISVNAAPASFAPPAGKGPLWFIASQSVTLMDQVTRAMGTYQIDANGFIIPQNNGGEDLTVASLVAGQPWTSTAEPFCPNANPGTDVGQRMSRRRISRFAAYVVHSTGFVMGRLFAGPVTATSPALGTLMNSRRVTAWNQDDDPTKPPPSRETVERIRPIGRAYDPRVAIIKDTPGPLQILELGLESTI